MKNVTDNHWHRIEEQRHAEHAMRREQARAGDGTIEQGEQELARIRAAKHRNEIAALKAQNDDLRRQLDEAFAGSNQDTEEAAHWLIQNPVYEVRS